MMVSVVVSIISQNINAVLFVQKKGWKDNKGAKEHALYEDKLNLVLRNTWFPTLTALPRKPSITAQV